MEEKRFYAIQQRGRTAELAIFGPIRPIRREDNDVTAWNILQELRALDVDEIHVHVNCPGGSVGEAFAIYNVLREHQARVNTYADGYVGSAAIYPFLAGERRVANPVSAFYFHPVQMEAYGSPEELRKAASQAELLTEQGIKAFEAAGVQTETARELVARDDFAAPEEMVELGVATELGQQDDAENASQSILPMVAQMIQERRQRKTDGAKDGGNPSTACGGPPPLQAGEVLTAAGAETQIAEKGITARETAKLGEILVEGLEAGLQEGAAEAQRPGLRAFFDGMLRDIVQGTPREGAGAPTGLVNDPALREGREAGEAPSNRLAAWLGLRVAE